MLRIGTELFGIEPIGLNTGMIESQTSYISRLAELHSVSVGTLMGKKIAPVLGKDYLTKSCINGGSRFYEVARELNGFGKSAIDSANGLSELTGCNTITNTTLALWQELFPTRRVLRQTKAWCPICYEDWKRGNSDIYEPLLWNFKAVNICDIHGVRIKIQCPFCGKEIPVLSRKSRNGYCSFCGCWLGSIDSNLDEEITLEQVSWEYFKVTNIEGLLKARHDPSYTFSVEKIHSFLKSAINKAGGKSAFSRNFRIPKTTVRTWYEGKHRPSLNTLLKICYRLNIEIIEVFSSKQIHVGSVTRSNDFYTLRDIKPMKTTPRRRKFDGQGVEIVLIDVINSKIVPPPSVCEVARNLQCDKKLLYNHFPDLCKKISENYASFLKMRKRKRIEEGCQKVSEATLILYNSGIYPSRRRIESFLSPNIFLREKAYQTAWKETLVSLGLLELTK